MVLWKEWNEWNYCNNVVQGKYWKLLQHLPIIFDGFGTIAIINIQKNIAIIYFRKIMARNVEIIYWHPCFQTQIQVEKKARENRDNKIRSAMKEAGGSTLHWV